MKGNPAVSGGSLTSKPTPRNTPGYSAASAFFVREIAAIRSGAGAAAGHLARRRLLLRGMKTWCRTL